MANMQVQGENQDSNPLAMSNQLDYADQEIVDWDQLEDRLDFPSSGEEYYWETHGDLDLEPQAEESGEHATQAVPELSYMPDSEYWYSEQPVHGISDRTEIFSGGTTEAYGDLDMSLVDIDCPIEFPSARALEQPKMKTSNLSSHQDASPRMHTRELAETSDLPRQVQVGQLNYQAPSSERSNEQCIGQRPANSLQLTSGPSYFESPPVLNAYTDQFQTNASPLNDIVEIALNRHLAALPTPQEMPGAWSSYPQDQYVYPSPSSGFEASQLPGSNSPFAYPHPVFIAPLNGFGTLNKLNAQCQPSSMEMTREDAKQRPQISSQVVPAMVPRQASRSASSKAGTASDPPRSNDGGLTFGIETPIVRPKKAPRKPSRNSRGGSKYLTKRNPGYTLNKKYKVLSHPPASWGCFNYDSHGELDPSRLYTPAEISSYLLHNPLHIQDPSALQIRIHRNPARSRFRFPTQNSHRCRFDSCPAANNTINQGHIIVAFDELASEDHDPFLNAGYVHLTCLERFCDFPFICRTLNIAPDNRELAKEPMRKNPMRLSLREEEKLIQNYIDGFRSGRFPIDYPALPASSAGELAVRPYKGTLCHKLALLKLQMEPKSIKVQRNVRENLAGYEGGTLSSHLGDLEVEAERRAKNRMHKNQTQRVAQPKGRRNFRAGDAEEEDNMDDDDDEDERVDRYVIPVAQMLTQTPAQPSFPAPGNPRKRGRDSGTLDMNIDSPPSKRRQDHRGFQTAGSQPQHSYFPTAPVPIPTMLPVPIKPIKRIYEPEPEDHRGCSPPASKRHRQVTGLPTSRLPPPPVHYPLLTTLPPTQSTTLRYQQW